MVQNVEPLVTNNASPAMTPTGNGASPVLGSPHPSYSTDASDPPVVVPRAPEPTQPYYVDTSGNVVDSNGAAVYIRRGTGSRTDADPYTYTRAKSDPNRTGNPVPLADRFDYNEEAILVTVAKLNGNAFGALGVGDMDISIKGGNYFIAPQHVLASAPTLTETEWLAKQFDDFGVILRPQARIKLQSWIATEEKDFPRNIADDILGC